MRALVSITSAALLCLATVALVDAQTTSTATAQSAKPEQTGTTIVGCLVQGSPTGAGTERRSDTADANANDFFVRTPTVAVPAGATVAVGKPGTTSTATSAGTPTADSFYRITGVERDKLRPHVGHRMELRGHLTPTTSDTPTGVSTAKTAVDRTGKPTTTVETRPIVAGVLHATEMKMVSANCP